MSAQTFTQLSQPGIGPATTQHVELYDVDADGNLDLFFSNLTQFGYRLGSSNGVFGSFNALATANDTRGFVFADYNNDGLDDIILGVNDPDRGLSNNGDGTYTNNSTGIGGLTITLDVADLNNDGFVEAVNSGGNIYLNGGNSSPRFSIPAYNNLNGGSFPAGFNPGEFQFSDLDSDGDADIVVANRGGQNIIFETVSVVGTTYSYNLYKFSAGSGDSRRIAVVDFDLDGNLDIVNLQRGLSHTISFGKGGLLSDEGANWDDVTLSALPTIDSRDVEVFDFNYDGLTDILISGDAGEAYLLRNAGGRVFTLEQSFSISSSNIFDATIGDVDRNGSPDIVFGINGASDQVWVNNLLPNPTPSFSSSALSPAATAFVVNIDFTETVIGFELSDIQVSNATLNEFTEIVTGQSYSMLVTPVSNGLVTLDIPAGIAVDIDNNANEPATQFSISADLMSATFNEDLPITCNGGTGAVSYSVSGGTSPYDFQWLGTGSNGQYISNFDLFTSAVGDENYTVNIRDANGYMITRTFLLSQPEELTFTASITDLDCNNEPIGEIAIVAEGGTGPYEYTIDGGNTFQTAALFTSLNGGVYSVGVRDANNCLTLPYSSITVSEPAAAAFTAGSASSTATTYGNSITYDVSGNAATTHWHVTNIDGGVISINNNALTSGDFVVAVNPITSLSLNPTSAGTISFDIQAAASDREGCLGGSIENVSIPVSRASLAITANDQTKSYGEENPSLTVSYAGFVNGEDENVLSTLPFVTTSADAASAVGDYDIIASAAIADNYLISYIDGTLTINQAALTVVANNQSITYGASFPTLGGTLSGVVNNDNISALYSTPADGQSIGAFDIVATLNDPDNKLSNYTVSNTSGTLTIAPADLAAIANNKAIVFGDAIPTLDGILTGVVNGDDISASYQTTATSNSNAGTYPITVSLTDPDTRLGNYSVSQTDGTLTIAKADQQIIFSAIEDIDLANANSVTLTATSDSGFPVTYSLDQGDGSISGNTLTVNATGNFTVSASQPGDNNFNAAPNVSQSFQVTDSRKTDQTITFASLSDKAYGDAPFTLTATATSQLTVSYTATGPVSIVNGEVTILGAGEAVISAAQEGDNSFNPAPTVSQTLMINKATLSATADDQQISFGDDLPSYTISYAGFIGSDEASDLVDVPSATSIATLTSDVGTYTIIPAGGSDLNYDFNYINGTLTIIKADQAITFPSIADIDISNSTTVNLLATSDAALSIAYSLDEGDGSIAGDILTINSTGNFTVTATQVGNANYNAAQPISRSFVVTDSRKQDQTISFSSINEQVYGDNLTLNATASSSLPIDYALTVGSGTIANGVLTIEGVGSYEITASQSGNSDFNPAQDVIQTFEATKAPLNASADNVLITEGDDIPTLTITYSGFKLMDDLTDIDTTPMVSTTATPQSGAGTYPISLTGGTDDRYVLNLINGTLTIESVLGGIAEENIEIYPNPAIGTLKVKGTTFDSLKLFDLEGRLVFEVRSSNISLEGISKGVYFLRLYKEDQEIHSQKLIIN